VITRINYKKSIDVYETINRIKDAYQDFYVTINKARVFLNNWHIIKKILNTQEVYALSTNDTKGLLILYKEKGFRPYVKILAEDSDSQRDLIKFLIWNFSDKDLFIKLKKANPLARIIQRYGFIFQGDRGQEILLFRKGERKSNKPLGEKDDDNFIQNPRSY